MMRWVKGWALLFAGTFIFALGFISAVNFSFEWDYFLPSSIVLAVILVPAGGTLFAQGLLALDSSSNPSAGQAAKKEAGNGTP